MTEGLPTILGLLVLGGALAVSLAELAVRWWIGTRGRSYLRFPGMRAICEIDPSLADQLASPVRYTVNAAGARGQELPRRAGRCFRVTLVGGSAAEGGALSDDRCPVGLLHARLNDPAALARVGADFAHAQAFAASLVDAGSLARLMSRTLPTIPRQDVVLLMTGASDFIRWLLAGAPPDETAPDLDDREFLVQYPGMPFTWRSPALGHAAKRVAYQALHWTVRRRIGRYPLRERAARSTVREFEPLPGEPTAASEHYRGCLAQLVQLSRTWAHHVLVVLQGGLLHAPPTPSSQAALWLGRLGPPRAPGPPRFVSSTDVAHLFHLARRISIEVSRAEGVPTIDLTQIEPSLQHYYDDAHLTEAGAERAAELMLERIVRVAG